MTAQQEPHILIVDDEESIRVVLSAFLKHKGFTVTAVENLQTAQKALENTLFDLVVLDVQLPDGNGMDLLAEIHRQLPELPVLILTGLGFEEPLLQQAKVLGAKGFISKSLPAAQTLMEIRHVLNPRRPLK